MRIFLLQDVYQPSSRQKTQKSTIDQQLLNKVTTVPGCVANCSINLVETSLITQARQMVFTTYRQSSLERTY